MRPVRTVVGDGVATRRKAGATDLRFLAAGIIVLAVAMGVGRFAYTPLLPIMRREAGLSPTVGGILASVNLAGYLAGALVCNMPTFRRFRVPLIRYSIALSIASTGLMAVQSEAIWFVARALSGVASGFVFVLASSVVLDRAALGAKRHWPAIFYSGVGFGIALCGLLVPPFVALAGWRGGWLGLCIVSFLACAITVPWLQDVDVPETKSQGASAGAKRALFWWLFVAYGCEGFGYIVPATFMVAIVASTPGLASYAVLTWVIVGVVAIPSTFLWNQLGVSLGRGPALVLAVAVQALGVGASILLAGAAGAVVGAITLGGTFIGIAALANGLGRELFADYSHIAIGRLTVIYGVGQLIGPVAVTALATRADDYKPGLVMAGGVLALSVIVLTTGLVRAASRSLGRRTESARL